MSKFGASNVFSVSKLRREPSGEESIEVSLSAKYILICLNVVSITLLSLQIGRDPWGDELWTYFFIESPNDFLDRVSGDPHPVGFYLISLISNQIVSAVFPDALFWGIWPILKFASLLLAGGIFSILTFFACRDELKKNKQKAWIFATVLPSLTAFAATFGVATDLRSYGAQSIGAILIACGIWINQNKLNLTKGQLTSFVLSVTLLGSLDVWASILSVLFLAIGLALWGDKRKQLLLILLVWAPVIAISYYLGPLSGVGVRMPGFGNFTEWITGLAAGFSFQIWFAIPLFLVWLVYLISFGNREILAFEIPAIMTIVSAFVFSLLFIPIFKWYVLAPVYALLSSATIWRVVTARRQKLTREWIIGGLMAASMISTAINPLNSVNDDAIWTSRGALEDKQNWRQTSALVAELVGSGSYTEVLTNSVVHDSYLLPGIETDSIQRLDEGVCKQDSLGREILVMVNASSRSEQQSLEERFELMTVQSWPTGAVYIYTCG